MQLDVYVPSLDHSYEFEVDEDCTIKEMIREMADILWKECGSAGKPDPEGFMLFVTGDEIVLPFNYTVLECGLTDGKRLIML
ncbi:MAG: hypothetical protein IJ123_08775 [Blautia sp.]|nr:hypothetical protein [Blautia sp.]